MIPAGIDPGWQSNPGLLRDRTVSMQLQGALDRMPEQARKSAVADLARHPLAEYIASGAAGRDNHVAIAVLPARLVDHASAKSDVLKISGEIGQKAMRSGRSGRAHHPEATHAAYAMVQEIVDRGVILQDGEREFRFELTASDGLVWRAAVRRSRDGREWFLSTLFKVDAARAGRERISRLRNGQRYEVRQLDE